MANAGNRVRLRTLSLTGKLASMQFEAVSMQSEKPLWFGGCVWWIVFLFLFYIKCFYSQNKNKTTHKKALFLCILNVNLLCFCSSDCWNKRNWYVPGVCSFKSTTVNMHKTWIKTWVVRIIDTCQRGMLLVDPEQNSMKLEYRTGVLTLH